MPNKQWDRNRLISATKEEKFNIIKYEIDMFDKTCEEIFNPEFRLKEWLEINLLIESFAIHTRGLIDFFYGEKFCLTDLVAQDLLSENIKWKDIRPVETDMLKEVKEKASIQVAHPSLLRLVLEKDGKKGWIIPVIRRDIKEVIDTFHQYYK